MADNIDPNEINDLATAIGELAQSVAEIKKGFRGVVDETKTWNRLLNASIDPLTKDLPKGVSDSKDLWEAMTKDVKVFEKVQEHVTKMVNDEWLPKIEGIKDTHGELSQEYLAAVDTHEQIVALMDEQFGIAKRKLVNQEEANVALLDANKLVKDLGTLLRDPAQGLDNMLTSMGQVPQKIAEATKETGSFTKGLKKVGKDGLESITGPAKALFGVGVGGGIFLLGIAAATAALTGMFMLFKNFYNFLDKNVIPAAADFNKQIGGSADTTGQLKGQMMGVGAEFELLGMSFEEGASLVRNFAESFKAVKIGREEMKVAKKLVAEFGASAEDAGKLFLQFTRQGRDVGDIKETFAAAEAAAEGMGLPVNAVIRDMAAAPDALARFGTANAIEFAKATATAQSYGMSIKDVTRAFGDQMDTFDKTASTAANLNTVFGTNINSFELMLETDPTKRLEMLRSELVKNGKEWDNLSRFEQNVITQNLGVSKSQAALILGSEEQRRKLQAQKNEQESLEKATARWEKGIGRVKRTLIAWGKEIDMTMRSATELVSALFDLEEPGKLIPKITNKLSAGFRDVRAVMESWTRQLRDQEAADTFISTMQTMGDVLGWLWDKGVQINDWLGPFGLHWEDILTMVSPLYGIFTSIGTIVEEVTENFDNLKWAFDLWVTSAQEGLTEFKTGFTSLVDFISDKSETIEDVLSFLNPLGAVASAAGSLVTPRPQGTATPATLNAPTALATAPGGAGSAGASAQPPQVINLNTTLKVGEKAVGEAVTRHQLGG